MEREREQPKAILSPIRTDPFALDAIFALFIYGTYPKCRWHGSVCLCVCLGGTRMIFKQAHGDQLASRLLLPLNDLNVRKRTRNKLN